MPDACGTQDHRSEPVIDGFVDGPENALAMLAVQSVLDRSPVGYWPIVLYGPSGTGKSHVALGLAAAWRARFPRLPVVAATAVDFARELAEAIEMKTLDDFGGRYRQVALLVLDDLEPLAHKEAAQQELIHILDSLSHRAAPVVLTVRRAPWLLAEMAPALQSRLAAGLAVALCAPGPEARLAILRRLAAERSFEMPDEVLHVLAEGLTGTVPGLRAALMHMELAWRTEGTPLDVESARRVVAKRLHAREPSLREIAVLTARHFSLKLAELRSATRRRAVVTARGVAMYLARTFTGNSLDEIGGYFGGRDHTTVAHGCRRTEELLKTEPAVRMAVEQLQLRL